MYKIKPSLSLTRKLRNAEHFDFYKNITNHIKTVQLKPASLLPISNTFLNAFEKEDVIYKRFLRQEETRLINEAHGKRKNAYMALKHVVEAASYSDTPQVKSAAGELERILTNYIAIGRSPMTEVSAMIVNLVQDMRLAKYAAAATLVGAEDAIDRLERDNEDFMTLYAGRAYSEESEKEEGSLVEVRRLVDREFTNLCDAISVLYQINEKQQPKDPEVSETLSDIIRFFNSFIHQYETIYARRNPNYHAGSDKPSSPDDEHPSGGGDEPAPGIPQLAITAQ
jgi:hypothetical protein